MYVVHVDVKKSSKFGTENMFHAGATQFKGVWNYLIFIRHMHSPGSYGTLSPMGLMGDYLLKYSPYEQAVCCSVISTWSAKHTQTFGALTHPHARP